MSLGLLRKFNRVVGDTGNMLSGLESVDTVLDRVEYRAQHTENVTVDRVFDLGIHWEDAGPSHTNAGYFAKIDGKDMRLSDGAVHGACKLMKSKPQFFAQFSDRSKFNRTLIEAVDLGTRKRKGVLVRHNGLEVTAILPPDHKIRDAAHLLHDFMTPLNNSLGEIKGIHAIEQPNADLLSYRVVMGDNMVKSLDNNMGQFMAFVLTMSETGQIPCESKLGIYRTVCTNSAMRKQTVNRWDYRGDVDDFVEESCHQIGDMGHYREGFGAVFSGLLNQKLEVEAQAILTALHDGNLITRNHFEMAQVRVDEPTEDGRPVENQYDLFNVLTRSAQDLAGIQARERAETQTMALFTSQGGLREQLRQAAANN